MNTECLHITESALIICRGSTKEQVNTIPTQERICRPYADALKFEISTVLHDSGTSAEKIPFFKRKVTADAFDYIRAHGVKHIIISDTDRAFRDAEDCLKTIRILNNGLREDDRIGVNLDGIRGVAIHIVENGIDSRDEKCLLLLTIRAAVAQEENRKRRNRQKQNFITIKAQGQRCGDVPYGWDAVTTLLRTSKTGRQADNLVPNDQEQQVLAQIIRWNEAGESDNNIARRLNAANIRAKKGGAWYGATVTSYRKHARLAHTELSQVA